MGILDAPEEEDEDTGMRSGGRSESAMVVMDR